MYEVWICFGEKQWKMIGKTDSYMQAEDILLDAYIHRAADFISVAMYDQFDNRHMYVGKDGMIEQYCRVNWSGTRDETFKD